MVISMVTRRYPYACSIISVFVIACFGGNHAFAQGLVTDRPDFTESAIVVPFGSVQLEAGLTMTDLPASGVGDETEWTFGEALVRWGVARRFEARVEAPNYHRLSIGDVSADGFGDISVGGKYQIGPVGDQIDLAVIAMLSLPTGSDDFGSDEVEPEAIVTASRELGGGISIGVQAFAGLPAHENERSLIWGGTLVSAVAVGPVGIFAEFAMDVPEEGTAPIIAHGGVALPVSDRFQLDFHAGFGLSETAPDSFVGVGLSVGT